MKRQCIVFLVYYSQNIRSRLIYPRSNLPFDPSKHWGYPVVNELNTSPHVKRESIGEFLWLYVDNLPTLLLRSSIKFHYPWALCSESLQRQYIMDILESIPSRPRNWAHEQGMNKVISHQIVVYCELTTIIGSKPGMRLSLANRIGSIRFFALQKKYRCG